MNRFWGFDVTPWVLVGFLGQLVFGARFLIQWIASERRGESHVPIIFWYLSIVGGATLTVYAMQRHDIVFTLGQLFGLLFYVRNLVLIRRSRARLAAVKEHEAIVSDRQRG